MVSLQQSRALGTAVSMRDVKTGQLVNQRRSKR